eukprot:scaffold115206_cov31-Tisochrysis_lutea.AAC.5
MAHHRNADAIVLPVSPHSRQSDACSKQRWAPLHVLHHYARSGDAFLAANTSPTSISEASSGNALSGPRCASSPRCSAAKKTFAGPARRTRQVGASPSAAGLSGSIASSRRTSDEPRAYWTAAASRVFDVTMEAATSSSWGAACAAVGESSAQKVDCSQVRKRAASKPSAAAQS